MKNCNGLAAKQCLREIGAKLEQDNIVMTTISDIFTIPSQVHQGDCVLRLTEGVTRPDDTLGTYVVTPQLEVCFDQALGLIKSALESSTSKGAYCMAASAVAKVILWRC